jgi:hypothetical protein
MTTVEEGLGALASVRDPELDEPLTDLGFVAGVQVAPRGARRAPEHRGQRRDLSRTAEDEIRARRSRASGCVKAARLHLALLRLGRPG